MNSTAVNAGTVTGVQTAVPGGTYRTSSDQSSGNVFSMLMERSREADTSDRKTVSVDSTKKTADSSSQRSSASEIRDVSAAEPKSEEPSGTDRTEEKAEPKQKDEALEALSAALEAQIAVQNAAGSTKADPVKASKPAADVTAVTEPVSGEEAFSGQASMEDRTISTVPADSEQAGSETAAGDRKEETIPEEKDTPVQKETLKEASGAKSEKTEVYSDEKQEKVDSSEKRSDSGGSVKKSESRRHSSERHQGPGDSYKEEARDSETGPGVNMASAAGSGRTEALGPGIDLQSLKLGMKESSPADSETLVQTLKTSEDALPRSVSSLLLKSVSDGKRELELKLEPKNLGKLSLKLSISESGIRVSITATEKRTEALLSAHADEMASILTKNTGEETKIFVPRQDAGAKPGQNSGQESESEGEMYQEDRQREQQESRRNHQSESFLQRMRLGIQ